MARGKKDPQPRRRMHLLILPWVVLALGLGATFALWNRVNREAGQAAQAEFEYLAGKAVIGIEARLQANVQVLRGVAGLFAASDEVTRKEFRGYVESLRLPENFPGIQGVGFSLFLSPSQLEAHIEALRREGFPSYAIHPAGRRDFYTAVTYVEPFSGRNLRAFGYDMGPEPVRWEAAVRSRDEGRPALSGKVTLQQETGRDVQPGFVLFLPVYRPGSPPLSVVERRARLTGWAYLALRMNDLMHAVLEFQKLPRALELEIFDGESPSPATLLFSQSPAPTKREAAYRSTRRLLFGGQPWTVRATSTPSFEARQQSEKADFIALSGSAVSLLLAFLVWALVWKQLHLAAALERTERTLAARQEAEEALRSSERRFRSCFEMPLVGICIVSPDKGWLDFNDRMCEIVGYTREELTKKSWVDLTHPDDLAAEFIEFDRARAGEIDSFTLEKRYLHADGHTVFIEMSAACVRGEDMRPLYFVGFVQDITERHRIEMALHFTQAVVERMSDAAYWAQADGRLAYVNAAACRMLGYSVEEFLSLSVRDIVPDFSEERWAAHWKELRQKGSKRFESRQRKKDGEVVTVEIQADLMRFQGKEYACGLIRDITERKRVQESLQEQAVRDPLTGLFNRRYLDATLPREFKRAQRLGEPMTVAMLDVDHFKRYNDDYGHEAGDAVLREVGAHLHRFLRQADIACRYGGDEITLILPAAALADARIRLEQLREEMARLPIRAGDRQLPAITVSIGASMTKPGETDIAAPLGRADAALYLAKAGGRNLVVVHDGRNST